MRFGTFEFPFNPAELKVAHRALLRESILPGGGEQLIHRKVPGDAPLQAQPLQSGGGQHQGGVLPLVQLPQTGLHIAPHRGHCRLGEQLLQLHLPPETGTADGL